MLQKYSKWIEFILIPIWVIACFFAAQAIILGIVWLLSFFNSPLLYIDDTLLNFVIMALTYGITMLFVFLLPWVIKKHKIKKSDIGLDRLPTWSEILITPAGLIVYLIASSALITIASNLIPAFDANQVQEVGFSNLNQQYEYILVFIILVVLVPFFEEILFRGFIFGKLKKIAPIWLAVIVTSVLFGVMHGAWNVAIDTVALSVVLCILRQLTGSIWPSILLHMTKNAIAYYFLFINTSLLTTLGR
ncbi:MAG: type II CAAX endopeptidase family protein [Candidatus Saccharibacteria bacterium]